MIYVCLSLVGALVAVTATMGQLLRSQQRAQTRDREAILNKLLHAVDKPWEPAPADDKPAPLAELREPNRYVSNIGRFPAQ